MLAKSEGNYGGFADDELWRVWTHSPGRCDG